MTTSDGDRSGVGPCDNPACPRPPDEAWVQEWRIAHPERGDVWRFCSPHCMTVYAALVRCQMRFSLDPTWADDRRPATR